MKDSDIVDKIILWFNLDKEQAEKYVQGDGSKKMEDYEKQIMIENYPRSTTIEGMKEISNQMEKCICKIYKKGIVRKSRILSNELF